MNSRHAVYEKRPWEKLALVFFHIKGAIVFVAAWVAV